MDSSTLNGAAREFSEIFTDANVAQFLATQNWTCQVDREFDQVWVEPHASGDYVRSVLIPREKSFVDYGRRLTQAVTAIADIYGWRLADLAEQIAHVHADLFFVRIDQQSSDGTIPFRQATALLENIEQMIRAAALTAYNPHSTARGRVPSVVKEFLDDDVRMGHTKKGSFIITVAARLDQADVAQSPDRTKRSFTRQVMTQLARSVDLTRRFAQRGDDFVDLEAALEGGMRLPMVQALHDMGEAEGVRALDLSFEWAATEPQDEEVPERVYLERATIAKFPEVERRLARRFEPHQVTVVGPVIELKRHDSPAAGDEASDGEVVIRGDVDGRLARVTVQLQGQDHDWAIRAYRERLPFTVTGELARKGNSWRLEEPITVDPSFIEFRVKNELG